MAPRARFELATLRLTAECSTIELPGNCCGEKLNHLTTEGISGATELDRLENSMANVFGGAITSILVSNLRVEIPSVN